MVRAPARKAAKSLNRRVFDALPDTVDFRDQMFSPTLIEVPPVSDLDAYLALKLPVLDQGEEGACTGFGLAAVANYLLRNLYSPRKLEPVSPRMLYVMARRYDEWPDEDYEGSSARGAMKAWHKHGVCSETTWPLGSSHNDLSKKRALEAIERPLGAYYRVNHKNLVAMHSALTEVGILYASADVHKGWDEVGADGIITFSEEDPGGHAFAIVGYDSRGFWIQNSWGPDWGKGGLAHISYDDWLTNGADVWVARLGAPVFFTGTGASAEMRAGAPRTLESQVFADLRNHIVTLENDGRLRAKGMYGLTDAALADMVLKDVPQDMKAKRCNRLMIHAHGGLVPEDYAVQYVANHRQEWFNSGVYPFSFIWRSDALTTISNILQDAFGKRWAGGALDSFKDFMLDRLDDTMEPVARTLGGKALWDEMKENATRASQMLKVKIEGEERKIPGGAYQAAGHLKQLVADGKLEEIHLVGHSAGAIFHAHFAELLTSKNELGDATPIKSLSLWAPACTVDLFLEKLLPKIHSGRIEAFDLYTLDDPTEQDDDCKNIYHKSLLYLVSNAFEQRPHIPAIRDGWPLLGMHKFVEKNPQVMALFKSDPAKYRWFKAPTPGVTAALHHGDFDNDKMTLATTARRISGSSPMVGGSSGARPRAEKLVRLKKTLTMLQGRGDLRTDITKG